MGLNLHFLFVVVIGKRRRLQRGPAATSHRFYVTPFRGPLAMAVFV